jgi:hypothetical protein
MAGTRRRVWQIVSAVAALVVVVASVVAVRSALRARDRLKNPEAARRARVAPDPPRLDVRQRNQPAAPGSETVPLAAPIGVIGADPLSVAQTTAADYRQRARYPRWSQPIAGSEDPIETEHQRTSDSSPKGDEASLTGNYRDAAEEGDLFIDAEVAVKTAGRFHLEATLYSKDGLQPIGWAQHSAELPTGTHWLRLRFYGLILHERGIDGPYLVRSLALSNLTQLPVVKNGIARNAYVTGAYSARNFSDRSFDDPDLLEAADRIEQAIDGLQTDTGS